MEQLSKESRAIWMKKSGDSLVPADREADSRLHDINESRLVMVSIRQPRNPRHHRMAWGIARLVYDNTERFVSVEHVMESIRINTGLVDRVFYDVVGVGRVEQLKPRSIAYESMGQDEFSEWWDRALDHIVKDVIPGMDKEELLTELNRIIG